MRRALSTLVLLGFVTLVALAADVAHAQVVQPQYVRPAKGARIVALSNKQVGLGAAASCPIGAPCLSAVYDMTAFNGVQVYLLDNATQGIVQGPWLVSNLPPFIKIASVTQLPGFATPTVYVAVLGASSSAGPFSEVTSAGSKQYLNLPLPGPFDAVIVPVPFADRTVVNGALNGGSQVFPSDVPPVVMGGVLPPSGLNPWTTNPASVENVGVAGSVDGFALLAEPPAVTHPNAIAAVNVTTGAGVPVYVTTNNVRETVRLQNVGANKAFCGFGPLNLLLFPPIYSFMLDTAGSASFIELGPFRGGTPNQQVNCSTGAFGAPTTTVVAFKRVL